MEAVRLRYLLEYRLIVCLEHRSGIVPTSVGPHLCKKHGSKGEVLNKALHEVAELQPPPLAPSAIPPVAHGTTLIPEIEAVKAYHCLLEGCNHEREALSPSRPTVEKHQARVHKVNDGRKLGGRTQQGTSAFYYQIAIVQIQTLLPQPYTRWFIIKEQINRPPEHLEQQSSTVELAQIDKDLETAKECDRSLYSRIPVEVTQAQLPPWLTRTGISNHLSGMAKERVNSLVGNASHGTGMSPIEGSILINL